MNISIRFATAAGAAALLLSACATSSPWEGRLAELDRRIDWEARTGALTPAEAQRMRSEFLLIADRRAEIMSDGATPDEHAMLDDLYDALAARISVLTRNASDRDGVGVDEWVDQLGQWRPIDQRQQALAARIDAGVRNAQLTRGEADRLRAEYRAVADLEAFYRKDGLSLSERADLDLRFDRLSSRVGGERRDGQTRNWFGGNDWTDRNGAWVSIDRRQRELENIIEREARRGHLTRDEAASLRREFHNLALLEESYRVNGISDNERAYLDNSFDALAARIFLDSIDVQTRDGAALGLRQPKAAPYAQLRLTD